MSQKPSDSFKPSELVAYQDGSIVSKVLLKQKGGNVTLFAFDAGQELSEHTAPFDAMASILDGEAEITIAGHPTIVVAGETIIMPADIPHALKAHTRFKMMLTMIRGT